MSSNEMHWNIIGDDDDPRYFYASKHGWTEYNVFTVIKTVRIPYWFAQFAQWNTAGVTAACEEYLNNGGYDISNIANPFMLINAHKYDKQ